mmetsp:Transcript_102494/g.182090  ORF Transcript_102494/g.182090 Transcript_102494/m.182090 type:complete len:303 (+) Transcript_102494:126-1034(+)
MWPYGRAVRAYAPDEALGYLSLRCGQNVEILHKDEDGWLFGSKASTEGVLEGKQHGWFPEELLLAPPPLQTPPQPSQDASSPADKALRVDEPEVVPEFTETLHPELTEKMSAFAPEDAPSLQIVTLGLEVAQIMCMDYNSLAQGLHEHHEALGSPLGPNACSGFDFCLDARCFGDPRCGPLRSHIGKHPEIIRRLVGSDCFAPWLQNARMLYCEARRRQCPGDKKQLLALVFCRSGRHRAVAAATILRFILLRSEGLRCPEPVHLSFSRRWPCQCWSCNCPEAFETILPQLEMASKLWEMHA